MNRQEEENPLISVIVPVYNGEAYLEKCIDSIEKQTYRNLEIIIIDDGSKDGTGVLCKKLALQYGNITVISLGDEGVCAARNAGLDNMRGEYAAFVDADDRLLPDTLSLLYSCIRKTGSDVAGCGFFSWREEAEFEAACAGKSCQGAFKEDDCRKAAGQELDEKTRIYTSYEFLREGILNGNSRCWSKLYRRCAIGSLRFRQGLTIGEDMLFLVDLLPRIGRVAEISYLGYGYFQNPAGAMNREFHPKYMDQITCWEIARERIADGFGGKALAGDDAGEEGKKQAVSQATAILIMAIMLTAGKLALLSKKERKHRAEYIGICRDKIKRELQVPGAYGLLSAGYKIKAKMFAALPSVYLWLYHIRKMG